MPAATSMPNRSGARSAARTPRHAKATKQAMTSSAPIRPSSSPMMAKMKSVWALGRKPHLARLRAEADAGHSPPAQTDERLHDLIAGVAGVRPRIDEGQEPGPAIGRRRCRGRTPDAADGAQPGRASRNGVPATKSSVTVTRPMTSVVPMSGSLHHSAATTPATTSDRAKRAAGRRPSRRPGGRGDRR